MHKSREIKDHLLKAIAMDSASVVAETSQHFGITREAVYKHLRKLIQEEVVETTGKGRSRTYQLNYTKTSRKNYNITADTSEFEIWDEDVKPMLQGLSFDDLNICSYGFTEMVNNVVDHSEGKQLTITVGVSAASVIFVIEDDGIGIFKKLTREFRLSDERQAILELSKGKLTTDPSRHTGEGIFFTSRIFDRFTLHSGNLVFFHRLEKDDWLLENELKPIEGTRVALEIVVPSNRTLQYVFQKFTTGPDEFSFSRTHVPLSLAQYGDDNLISRSQAKRVLARFDRFEEVILDFTGVHSVGQAFADEIFRVYPKSNPSTKIRYTGANKQVVGMIKRALNADATLQ